MEVTPLLPEGRQVVNGYRAGGFVVAGEWQPGSVLLLPTVRFAWSVTRFEELDEAAFLPLYEAGTAPEVLVLGTGGNFRMIDPRLRQALRQRGTVVECMATQAACRTYNVLLVEDRRVAAALIAIP